MRLRRKQTAHLQHRHVLEAAHAESLPTIVAYCGRVVSLNRLDASASIRVCPTCSQIARELEAELRGGAR